MSNNFLRFAEERLLERKQNDSLRQLNGLNESLVDFCSNDYLGLASRSIKPSTAQRGSTGSRLLTGNFRLMEETEHLVAGFHESEAALVFPSGYQANIALLSCLTKRQDTIIYDEKVHASMRDGIRLSGSRAFPFRHNDLSDLRKKLKNSTGNVIVAVESLYSMDGDFSPLGEILQLADESGFSLIVDEAHSGGIYGKKGKGITPDHPAVAARVFTYGKAFGYHGASVVSNKTLREYLINFSRPFIYSTGMPSAYAEGLKESYELIEAADPERKKLSENIQTFIDLSGGGMPGPIQTIMLEGNSNVRNAARALRETGLDVRAVLSPTVPKGSERIRISLHSFHSTGEIQDLVSALKVLK